MLIVLAETAHGAVREMFVAPVVGDLHARQLGVVIGSLIIFAIACATIRWMRLSSSRAQLQAGAIWVVLTLAFEVLLGVAVGATWDRILSDYNPARGGFMALGLAFMFFSPRLAAKLRRL